MALGSLPMLEALAVANVHAPLLQCSRPEFLTFLSPLDVLLVTQVAASESQVGDALLQSFWQRHVQLAPATSRSVLRSLSLEGAHGATLQGLLGDLTAAFFLQRVCSFIGRLDGGIWNLVRALGRGAPSAKYCKVMLEAAKLMVYNDFLTTEAQSATHAFARQ